jgi:Polyketide cyclase / dehydrase and lipid transport
MRRPWFKLEACDEHFLRSGHHRQVAVIEIPQPADRVWAALTSDDALKWCRALSGVTWTSPRPFGVGTTRTARTPGGALALKEIYFRWEDGRRKSFYVSEATLPLFRRFAEDYLVEETSPSSCRFTWTVGNESPPAARPGDPINGFITRSLFRDTGRYFGASQVRVGPHMPST